MKSYVAVSILPLIPDTDRLEQIALYTSNCRLFLIDKKKADSIPVPLKWLLELKL